MYLLIHLVAIVVVGAILWYIINMPQLALPAPAKQIAIWLFVIILLAVLFFEVLMPMLGMLSSGTGHTRLW